MCGGICVLPHALSTISELAHVCHLCRPLHLHARRYVTLWISLSATVILYNKYILTWGKFPYPVALTMWHMFFCSVMAAGIIRAGYVEPIGMSTETYLRCAAVSGFVCAAIACVTSRVEIQRRTCKTCAGR